LEAVEASTLAKPVMVSGPMSRAKIEGAALRPRIKPTAARRQFFICLIEKVRHLFT
jgi:hypothetical protein